MSYDVPTKKYPTGSDVDALATFLAQRQSDSGTTNGGIVAIGSPPLAQLGVDSAGISLSVLKAQVDALMCGMAFQQQTEVAVTLAGNTVSTSFANIPNLGTVTYTAPMGKVYVVEIDGMGLFQSVIGGAGGIVLRLSNNTNGALGNTTSWSWFPPALNTRGRFNAKTPITMQAGANVLQLQWRMLFGGDTGNLDTLGAFAFTVRG